MLFLDKLYVGTITTMQRTSMFSIILQEQNLGFPHKNWLFLPLSLPLQALQPQSVIKQTSWSMAPEDTNSKTISASAFLSNSSPPLLPYWPYPFFIDLRSLPLRVSPKFFIQPQFFACLPKATKLFVQNKLNSWATVPSLHAVRNAPTWALRTDEGEA